MTQDYGHAVSKVSSNLENALMTALSSNVRNYSANFSRLDFQVVIEIFQSYVNMSARFAIFLNDGLRAIEISCWIGVSLCINYA